MMREDLKDPRIAESVRQLGRTARALFWQGTPFAHHGILRHRWRLTRWHEQWEYAKSLAVVPWERSWNVVDVGGAASLPVYHLALEGCTVTTLDQDPELVEATRKFSEEKSLALAVVERSLVHESVDGAGEADWVFCHSFLESHSVETQCLLCKKMSELLKPGGILTLTFQYGEECLVPHAPNNEAAVMKWLENSGLNLLNDEAFVDNECRYSLDGRMPERQFTLGSLFLIK